MLCAPLEDSLSVRWIGHERRRITGPPRCQFAPHAASGNTFRSLYDFKYRVPLAGPKIRDQGFATVLQILQRSNMGIRQIADVDVVANAGAVRSWIVRSVNLQLGTSVGASRESERDEVSLGACEARRCRRSHRRQPH